MIIKKNGQYAVECQVKMAPDCLQAGVYFDSEEEAQNWAEDECWIFSGEGWICIQCNEQIISNLRQSRRLKG